MIFRLQLNNGDIANASQIMKETGRFSKKVDLVIDYSKVIVKKPWGYEYLVFENDFVAIWMLQIVRKRKTSMHCHPNKKTALVLLSGNATCSGLERSEEIGPLDGVMVDAGAFHSTEATSLLPIDPLSENGIWMMEIESPPDKTDLVRLKDNYGRTGKAYEDKSNMVFDPSDCVKFKQPDKGNVFAKRFQDCLFTIRQGPFRKGDHFPSPKAKVIMIGTKLMGKSVNSYLQTGELFEFEKFFKKTENEKLEDYTFLTIDKMPISKKLSDYVFSTIADLGVTDVFTVSGGAAMHLLDSLGTNKSLKYVTTHHEQAAAMAAEGYARTKRKPGVALVTSGPGGTNALTGVCGAWIDSIPTIFISGQVTSNSLIGDSGLRQCGIQESDIVSLVKSVTKYSVTVTDPSQIKYHLQKAIHLATTGRPGPVWLDIPLDIQSKVIIPDKLPSYEPKVCQSSASIPLHDMVQKCVEMLEKAHRPVLISGYGIRLAEGEKQFLEMIEKLGIPVINSWTTSDLISSNHELCIGRCGIFGDRAGNFTVQNSDLLLSVGSRLSVPQTGYQPHLFAREAKKILVDIDPVQLKRSSLKLDLPIQADAREFMTELINQWGVRKPLSIDKWLGRCRGWREKYPIVLEEYKELKDAVNSFHFIDVLSKKLDNTAVVVTDMGTSFTCTMQTFKTKLGQRLFTSSGHASMGFGLPGAIGACVGHGRQKTICVSGDGGLQMNIQELQTLAQFQFPIILFVLNNQGYLTIKATQQNHFGRFVGSEKSSSVTCPDIVKVAQAHEIATERISNTEELHAKIDGVLNASGPLVCEVIMPETQPLIPRVSSLKKPDGSIVSKPLEDLFPFLDRDEFAKNMIVDPVEILK